MSTHRTDAVTSDVVVDVSNDFAVVVVVDVVVVVVVIGSQ